MNLQQLKYILEIADCRSITRASRKLFVSQPYLSKVIADYEARVKKTIFIRNSQGVELTAYGKKVCLLARSVVRQMELLERMEQEESLPQEIRTLSFSVSRLLVRDTLFSDFFSASRTARVELDFRETSIEECVRLIEEEKTEFAIVAADDFQKSLLETVSGRGKFVCRELDQGDPYCHLHRQHPLADQERVSMESLLQYPFVRLKADAYTAASIEKFREAFPELYVHRCIIVSQYGPCLDLVKSQGAFMIGNKWQIPELEKQEIHSIRCPFLKYKMHLLLLKREARPFSQEAERFLLLFKDSYGLDGV